MEFNMSIKTFSWSWRHLIWFSLFKKFLGKRNYWGWNSYHLKCSFPFAVNRNVLNFHLCKNFFSKRLLLIFQRSIWIILVRLLWISQSQLYSIIYILTAVKTFGHKMPQNSDTGTYSGTDREFLCFFRHNFIYNEQSF